MNLLIVEDDKEILNSLESSLKAEGFVVDSAEDGKVGSNKARTNDYDLLILDIGLPNKDGREICSEVRVMGKNMPILILSVKGEVEDKVEILNIGADDYMTKPFLYQELSARVRALLRRPRRIEGEVFRVNDVELNTRRRTVTQAWKEVHLTPKEFSLLEYLLRNRGRALSRQAILEHVCDVNADPFSNTIETHIVNLRKKLKKSGKVIHTVTGIGYKIP